MINLKIKKFKKPKILYNFFGKILIILGVVIFFFCLNYKIDGDGKIRYDGLKTIYETHKLPDNKYSLIMPLSASPLGFIDKVFNSSPFFISRFNIIIFIIFLIFLWKFFRQYLEERILIYFFLTLIFGTMFAHHFRDFYAETFGTILIFSGFCLIHISKRQILRLLGWILLILAAINTPPFTLGIGFISLIHTFKTKNFRFLLVPIFVVVGILLENYLRRGGVGSTGYGVDKGLMTLLPYSGMPGFSYPFIFGVLSIIFSFGKGILFYIPGFFLPFNKIKQIHPRLRLILIYSIVFSISLILIYAKWWSWYGGWFWGPRFFLFLSIPASFFIAYFLFNRPKNLLLKLILFLTLSLSLWVSFNGAIIGQDRMQLCLKNDFALESFCHYTPEFSAIFRPFVTGLEDSTFSIRDYTIIGFYLIAFVYLSLPLASSISKDISINTKQHKLNLKEFKF